MELETIDIPEIAKSLAEAHPSEILKFALENYSGGVGISFSGAEDVVLIDLASKLGGDFRIFRWIRAGFILKPTSSSTRSASITGSQLRFSSRRLRRYKSW